MFGKSRRGAKKKVAPFWSPRQKLDLLVFHYEINGKGNKSNFLVSRPKVGLVGFSLRNEWKKEQFHLLGLPAKSWTCWFSLTKLMEKGTSPTLPSPGQKLDLLVFPYEMNGKGNKSNFSVSRPKLNLLVFPYEMNGKGNKSNFSVSQVA